MNEKKYLNDAAAQLLTAKDSIWQLGNTLRDCMRRLETIQETNPEIWVSDEVAQAKHTLEQYAKGCITYAPHPFGLSYNHHKKLKQNAEAEASPDEL